MTIRGLSKRFANAKTAVYDRFDLDIPRGKLVSVFGPNGCGKSTLINMIAGLIPPDAGEVLFDGKLQADGAVDARAKAYWSWTQTTRKSIDLPASRSAAADLAADDEGVGELNSAAGDQHLADHASDLVDLEVDQSLAENAENVIGEIDAALWRIEGGTYGTCAVCGAAIPEERLEAIPYATLCLDDKRRQEVG